MKELIGQAKVRDATVAGIFYPDDPSELEERVSALLEAARPSILNAKAIVSPHAGLDYSGDLSALAWKSASARRIDTVLILAPLHRAEESQIFLPESDYFEMPTGRVSVDRDIVGELKDCGTIMSENDIPHFEEHGIELQLPFMLAQFPEARLVPVLVGKPTPAVIKALASALTLVFADRIDSTLVVLSTDLGSAGRRSHRGGLRGQLPRELSGRGRQVHHRGPWRRERLRLRLWLRLRLLRLRPLEGLEARSPGPPRFLGQPRNGRGAARPLRRHRFRRCLTLRNRSSAPPTGKSSWPALANP